MKRKITRWILCGPLFLLAGVFIHAQSQETAPPQTMTLYGQECPITTLENGTIIIDASHVVASSIQVKINPDGTRTTYCGNNLSSTSEPTSIYTDR